MSLARRVRTWQIVSVTGVVLFASILWLARKPLLTAAGTALIEDDGVSHEQAAVVLGGDTFCSRIVFAAGLAQSGYVPFVIVSGPRAFGEHESDITIRYAESRGFPATIFRSFPNAFTSTSAEVRGIGDYLRENRITHILLVTSNYHTHRAARTFRSANPDIAVRVVPAPDPTFDPTSWWQDREGRKTFLLEWTKTVAYWFGV